MTLSQYVTNTQYQRTQLQYDAKISATQLQHNTAKQEENEPNHLIPYMQTPMVLTKESDLNDAQKLQKMILQKILGSFNHDNKEFALFPNASMPNETSTQNKSNPYNNQLKLPEAFSYSSSSEYYQKTTFEFSAQATIKTPNHEYNIEINFSFTQEFYERNETHIALSKEQFKNPFEIQLDKDDDKLKDLKSLHFIFDVYEHNKEDEKEDIFKQIRELLEQRKLVFLEEFNIHNKDSNELGNKPLDNFQIWQEDHNANKNLIAVQKEGIGLFLAHSSKESNVFEFSASNEKYSLQSSSYKEQTSYAHIELKI